MAGRRAGAVVLRVGVASLLAVGWASACASEAVESDSIASDSGASRAETSDVTNAGDVTVGDGLADVGEDVREADAPDGDADASPSDSATDADAGDASHDALDALADAGVDANLGSCSKDLDCSQGAFCNLDAGQCNATLSNGSTCNRAFQCSSRVCSSSTCVGCTSAAHCGAAASVCNGATQLCETCRAQGNPNPACSSAGWGNICVVGSDRCACGSSAQCTNARAPHCMAVSLNIYECECNYSGPCPMGTLCIGSFPGVCKAAATFPCAAPGECASGSCSNGTCD